MKEASQCVVIGTSAGGVEALRHLLPKFKKPSTLAIVVVLHLPPAGPNLIPSLFAEFCSFHIKEAESGETIEAETIYIAPPDYHLSIEDNMTLSLSTENPVNYSRPSIDILFDSAAYSLHENAIGILLTGANHDGAKGLLKIQQKGGKTIVQNPETAEYAVMPASALELFIPHKIIDLNEIPDYVTNLQRERTL